MERNERDAKLDASMPASVGDWLVVLAGCVIVYAVLSAFWAALGGPAALHELWQ